MRTAVIVNTNAGRFRRRPGLIERARALAGRDADCFATSSLAELDRAAEALAGREPDRVVLAGGDGTFMAGLSALARVYSSGALPVIVLAPAGTAGTVPRGLGQRGGFERPLRRATAPAPLGWVERPTISVSDSNGARRVGFIFGTGLVARFFDHYEAAGAGGYLVAARIAARVFVGALTGGAFARSVLEPLPCRLSVDGALCAPCAWSLIVSSTIRDLGLHFVVTHRGGEDPARPHLVASPLGPRALGVQLGRVLTGRPLTGAGNVDALVSRFELDFPDGPGPYILDGDLFSAARVTVEAGPRVRIARV
ncbi:MAG: diacylglycerol kinase family protein [Sorangiineae bacterium]|nr:diacylglycerol kinase family protein [Polyangiaceae bacterium]MEB2324107.1 diacylglycerol kinase family protein [Sorangiineae bacterium]